MPEVSLELGDLLAGSGLARVHLQFLTELRQRPKESGVDSLRRGARWTGSACGLAIGQVPPGFAPVHIPSGRAQWLSSVWEQDFRVILTGS